MKMKHPSIPNAFMDYYHTHTQTKLKIPVHIQHKINFQSPMMMKINTFYTNFVLAKSNATKAH